MNLWHGKLLTGQKGRGESFELLASRFVKEVLFQGALSLRSVNALSGKALLNIQDERKEY